MICCWFSKGIFFSFVITNGAILDVSSLFGDVVGVLAPTMWSNSSSFI